MERSYIAFISYRHSALDTKVAEKLHRLIERYTIPKDLRSGTEKHLGLVFRDRDELAVNSSLTDEIYKALDNSRYLIVICTPDTPKSQWVPLEIEYFIAKHGRDKVLTVLADGTIEQSVPDIITNIYAENGSLIQHTEPLSAYIAAENEETALKNLDKEFLRIAAALMGVPYDALRQRQKRYRQQRISIILGIVALIAAGFVAMLLNRNAEINRQLEQSLKNESYALSMVSSAQLEEGNRYEALETALSALPSAQNDRPYSAYAEKALTDALYVYEDSGIYFDNSIEQSTEIYMMDLSADGSRVVTMDKVGLVRCFDTRKGNLLWSYRISDFEYDFNSFDAEKKCIMMQIANATDTLVIVDKDRLIALSLADGSVVQSYNWYMEAEYAALSEDGSLLAVCLHDYTFDTLIYETDSFTEVMYLPLAEYDTTFSFTVYSAVFSRDNSMFALSFDAGYNEDIMNVWALSFDIESGEPVVCQRFDTFKRLECAYTDYNQLAVMWTNSSYLSRSNKLNFMLFDKLGQLDIESVFNLTEGIYSNLNSNLGETNIPDILVRSGDIALVYGDSAVFVDAYKGELLSDIKLASDKAHCFLDDTIAVIICDNGTKEYIRLYTGQNYSYLTPLLPDINTDLYLAAGSCTDNQGLCLVPAEEKNRILFIRRFENDSFTTLEAPFTYNSYFSNDLDFVYPFPSGKYFLSLARIDQNSKHYNLCSVYDSTTLEKVKDFIFLSENYVTVTGFSADERKIIFGNYYYDLDNDINTHLDLYGDFEPTPLLPFENTDNILHNNLYSSAPLSVQKAGQAVYTACYEWALDTLYMWKDTQLIANESCPFDIETYNIYDTRDEGYKWLTGQSGVVAGTYSDKGTEQRVKGFCAYSADTQSWHTIENLCETDGFAYFAVGNKSKIIASADTDGQIRFYDVEKEKLIRQFTPQLDTASVVKMDFMLDDSVLCFLLDNNSFAFINAADGQLLTRISTEDFGSASYITVYENPSANEIYICNSYSGHTVCMDTQYWAEKYSIGNCYCIINSTAVCLGSDYTITVRPVYSTEQLIAMANELITAKEAAGSTAS